MSHEPDQLGTEAMIDTIAGPDQEAFAPVPASTNVSAWRPFGGYRWHIKDKNVRGTLFPEIDIVSVGERLERFRTLLGLGSHMRIETCGNKVLLASPRPLAFATRLRQAVGQRW